MKTRDSLKRVVDLCIYVDENAYKEDVDKEKLFDALYNIVIRISHKHRVLLKFEDYESFALYAAGRLYTRLTNPKLFLPDDDPKKLKQVKSILNMIKATLQPMIVDWLQSDYALRFGYADNKYLALCAKDIRYSLELRARSSFHGFLHVDYEYYLKKISNTIHDFLKTTPYVSDPVTLHRLYISCMMTLLNLITLNNANKERLRVKESGGYKLEEFINNVYLQEKARSVVTFKLDPSLYNYVDVLVNRIRSLIVKDLRGLIGDAQPSDAVMESIIASNMGERDYDQE